MRWLIALGLVVAACSGSSGNETDALGNAPEGGSDGGAGEPAVPSAGAIGKPGKPSNVGGQASSGPGGAAGAAGAAEDEPTLAGAGGEAGGAAGHGGEANGGAAETAGAAAVGGGAGSSSAGSSSLGGAGGQAPSPSDPCAEVPAWDPAVPYTELVKDELRTLRGQLWKCSSTAACTSHPGNPTSPGWQVVANCQDPNEGGEPACQCESGACCDGCFFRPPSHHCGTELRYSSCEGVQVASCGGAKSGRWNEYYNLFCSGDTGGACTRWGGSRISAQHSDCAGGSGCTEGGAIDTCQPCSGL